MTRAASRRPAGVPSLTWRQVLGWRVRRHHLDERVPRDRMLEVASRLCGLHAQLMSSAELTLWARVDGIESGDLARALWEDRSLVKLWAMRGTLHLLPAAEYPMWQAALSTHDHFRKGAWLRAFGVTDAELDRVVDAIGSALARGPLTREELAAAVARRTRSARFGEKLRESWGALLKPASFSGRLCFAPSDGQRVRFASPDAWLGERKRHDPEQALSEVARRYLGAYGPASREDLARWWGPGPARAGRMIAVLGDEVVEVAVAGSPAWMLREHLDAAAVPPVRSVRLLPGFDQYVVGATRGATAVLPAAHVARVYRPQGWISPVLLVGGRVEGVWRHERRGGRVVVEIEPFGRAAATVRRGAEAEAKHLAAFLGLDLDLRWA